MNEEKKETTIEECIEHGAHIRKRYRACLLEVGKSPDYHIYDLTLKELRGMRASDAKRFLLKLVAYYLNLCDEEKALFVREILEKDRHYRFWFYDTSFPAAEFERRRNNAYRNLRMAL